MTPQTSPLIIWARWVACAGSVALGLLAFNWGLSLFPVFWQQAGLAASALHIKEGAPFRVTTLTAIEGSLDANPPNKWQHPSASANGAIVKLRALEQTIASGDTSSIDARMDELRGVIRRSLADTPADPFLWLTLYWLENTRLGFTTKHLNLLEMSYATGPQEGGVALRRSRWALAIFSFLPPHLADNAVKEFAGLVQSKFYGPAADIFTGHGWDAREALLAGLANIPSLDREQFAKLLYRRGYDVTIPGVELPPERPWRWYRE